MTTASNKKNAANTEPNTEVVEVEGWTDKDMEPYQAPANELSWQELIDNGVIDIQEVDDLVQLEKDKLVGQPFIITKWSFNQSSYGQKTGVFAVVHVATPQGRGFFVDGSTGICEQLQKYEDKLVRMKRLDEAQDRGILVRAGLRASHYVYKDDVTGDEIPATTYYFDNRDV